MVRGPGRHAVRHRPHDASRLPGGPQGTQGHDRGAGRDEAGRRDVLERPIPRASGGPDLLILDAKNVLWRWRPADDEGSGTLTRVNVQGSTSWGDDITGVQHVPPGRLARPVQPLRDRPVRAADPGLLAGRRRQRLPGRADRLARHRPGPRPGWAPPTSTGISSRSTAARSSGSCPARTTAGTRASRRTSCSDPRPRTRWSPAPASGGSGTCMPSTSRMPGSSRSTRPTASYRGQYRLAGGAEDWSDLRAMYVIAGIEEGPATVVWLSDERRPPGGPRGRARCRRREATPSAAPSAATVRECRAKHGALTGRRDPAPRRQPDPPAARW